MEGQAAAAPDAVRASGKFQILAATEKLYAIARQGRPDYLRRVAVFAGENALLGFHQKNLRAKTREALRHLAADGTRADDPQSLWQFG